MVRKPLAAALVAALCSGCGSGTPTQNAAVRAPKKVYVEWDATGAVNTVPAYKQEVISLIQQVAAGDGEVFAAVLDGQPITTASVASRNFAEVPPETEPQERPAINQAVATGFARNFIATCTTHEVVAGSGQLQGLALAAATSGVSEVYMWSDGVVNEPANNFDLTTASAQELNAEIAQWKPKLTGLKGMTVVVVGAGRGAHRLITAERAHQLFQAVVEGNGGTLVWVPTLAQR